MALPNLQTLVGAFGQLQQANAAKRQRELAKRRALTQGILSVGGAALGFFAGGPAGAAVGGKAAGGLLGAAGGAGGPSIASLLPGGLAGEIAPEGGGVVAEAAAQAPAAAAAQPTGLSQFNPLSGLSRLQAAGTLSRFLPAVARGDAGAATGAVLGAGQQIESNEAQEARRIGLAGLSTSLADPNADRRVVAGQLAGLGLPGPAATLAFSGGQQGQRRIIKDAEGQLGRAIHRIVANAAITAHDFYNIERHGENLVITVKLMTTDPVLDRQQPSTHIEK